MVTSLIHIIYQAAPPPAIAAVFDLFHRWNNTMMIKAIPDDAMPIANGGLQTFHIGYQDPSNLILREHFPQIRRAGANHEGWIDAWCRLEKIVEHHVDKPSLCSRDHCRIAERLKEQ